MDNFISSPNDTLQFTFDLQEENLQLFPSLDDPYIASNVHHIMLSNQTFPDQRFMLEEQFTHMNMNVSQPDIFLLQESLYMAPNEYDLPPSPTSSFPPDSYSPLIDFSPPIAGLPIPIPINNNSAAINDPVLFPYPTPPTVNLTPETIASPQNRQKYTCPECNNSFSRPQDVIRHIKSIHSTSRPYSCKKCSKRFARKDALKRHENKSKKEIHRQYTRRSDIQHFEEL